jgi:hypothetical protein
MGMRIVVLVAMVLGGCAHDVRARLPTPPGHDTGTVVILLPQPARDLTVAVNGTVVAERAHTRKVTVERVPIGLVSVAVAAGGGPDRLERNVDVILERGETVGIPVGSPERPSSQLVGAALLTIGAALVTKAVWLLLL